MQSQRPLVFSRRDILKLVTGASAWLASGGLLCAQKRTIIKRAIPVTNEELPVIGLGAARIFDIYAEDIPRPLREVMRLFVKHGGRLVDSSPMYGAAETVVGTLSEHFGISDQQFFATTLWTSGREAGIQ